MLLCLVPIGALLIEGAMMEWSALLMREWKGASPFVTALTFAVFALAMAVIRLAGDRLAEQFGPRPVILRLGPGHGARASSASGWRRASGCRSRRRRWSGSAAATSIR